ncbi:isoquinoline 1-oxidoreductase alpha subunit [Sphingobium sp. OAS761]|uniref:(2Fe-2S)-binding protein n=1 Tax=Sphingobium sp. OAS761 TaxID=2817901 RepID=UPI00209CC20B|nr:(2Fe-2S)-binding protein [Sphingobium sp. OAS761]MCP1471856.1 isoquinoline 1-oxidoreductase alpha subunit [Sphingobium sp. OAS761]
MQFELTVNGERRRVDEDPQTPLLWVLRDSLHLTGSKYGCGKAQCGACTVHLEGRPVRSCSVPVASVGSRRIETIEAATGSPAGPEARALTRAWVDGNVPQCGFCQSGQIMSAIALLRERPNPSDQDIDRAMSGNICRCATYSRIRAGIHTAAASLRSGAA